MNERFKFRFWDKKEKEYFTCGDIDHKSGIFKTYPYRTYNWCFEYKNIIAEQCTGLKDKNGKLIYEGDICRIKGTYYDCDYKEYFEVDENEEVESLEKFFGEAMLKGVYSALGCDTLQVEVIGNIHENADLIEEKNDNR